MCPKPSEINNCYFSPPVDGLRPITGSVVWELVAAWHTVAYLAMRHLWFNLFSVIFHCVVTLQQGQLMGNEACPTIARY